MIACAYSQTTAIDYFHQSNFCDVGRWPGSTGLAGPGPAGPDGPGWARMVPYTFYIKINNYIYLYLYTILYVIKV